MSALVQSIAMIAALLLTMFGVRLVWTGANRLKGALMLVMAVVLVGNVMIWTS